MIVSNNRRNGRDIDLYVADARRPDEQRMIFKTSGERWFAIEHAGVEPDIMVMAKGIANGMPVGATITRPDIAASWTTKTISTFGGNPVSMAATTATLEVMVEEDVPQRAKE
ncbi:MAG: aminotransferase class III-fold pyridoxal phosphate-dependent enzyme, partial [Planctomycetes bacterium]|nr:aminotransferase class III-fold pyridoxal phosphate-dependent enzyme [Planctomycetota bacterium]